MAEIYQLNALRHPFRAIGLALRRFTLRGLRSMQLKDDRNATNPATGDFDGGAIPPEFAHFQVGEVLPWKGHRFKVGKVVGGELPCIILVSAGPTRGTKLRTLKNFRDAERRRRVG